MIPEVSVGQRLHIIKDRIRGVRNLREALGTQPKTFAGKILSYKRGTPQARASEGIATTDQAQRIETTALGLRDWMVFTTSPLNETTPPIDCDEEGWTIRKGGLEVRIDDATKVEPDAICLVSVDESSSPHFPWAAVWFATHSERRYSLEISFRRLLGKNVMEGEYLSSNKSFADMPEDDAVIAEDLLARARERFGIPV